MMVVLKMMFHERTKFPWSLNQQSEFISVMFMHPVFYKNFYKQMRTCTHVTLPLHALEFHEWRKYKRNMHGRNFLLVFNVRIRAFQLQERLWFFWSEKVQDITLIELYYKIFNVEWWQVHKKINNWERICDSNAYKNRLSNLESRYDYYYYYPLKKSTFSQDRVHIIPFIEFRVNILFDIYMHTL